MSLDVSKINMRKIGTTSTGVVIVEMATDEYEALQKLQGGAAQDQLGAEPISQKMSHADAVDYVAQRLVKLSPKKKDGAIRSIEAMFQFSGGISQGEIEKILRSLQQKKILSVTDDGKIIYK